MRLRRASKVNLFIPVEFINENDAPGLKRGGVLTVVRPEVELIVTASEIPENITIDLTGLNVGDVITISSVTLLRELNLLSTETLLLQIFLLLQA